jgi:hypothetical protein
MLININLLDGTLYYSVTRRRKEVEMTLFVARGGGRDGDKTHLKHMPLPYKIIVYMCMFGSDLLYKGCLGLLVFTLG